MTKSKMLERLYALAHHLDEESKKDFDFLMKSKNIIDTAASVNPCAGSLLAQIIVEIEHDMEREDAEKIAKKGGRSSALKAARRIIKSAKAQPRESLWGAWISGDGAQYVCDGFRVVRFRNPIQLEQIPENVTPCNGAAFFDSTKCDRGEALKLPSASALRAFIKAEKARLKAEKDKSYPLWDFGDGLPSVDAGFLLDMLDAIPGAKAKASKKRPSLGFIHFDSEDGSAEGLLCPVRKGATK